MKKRTIVILSLLFSAFLTRAQWTDNGTNLTTMDNVGIGQSEASSKLDVRKDMAADDSYETVSRVIGYRGSSNHQHPMLTLSTKRGGNTPLDLGAIAPFYQEYGTGGLQFLTSNGSGLVPRMSVDKDGYLEINRTMSSDNVYESAMKLIGYRGSSNHQHPMLTLSTKRGGNSPLDLGAITSFYQEYGKGGLQFLTNDGSGLDAQMSIDKSGKVAIGTTDFSGSHKLRVEGSIGAREIKVEATGWSDFVFDKDYELRTLEEVEQHMTENGHLPEIPSEVEVTENGINLGEMNAKLLQKVEELTLYLIEEHKNNKKLQEEVEQLKKKVQLLEKQ